MADQMNRKWVLVTGASSGIGEAFARRFAREGWNVILVARSVDKLNELAEEFRRNHAVQTLVIGADLRVPTACRDIFEKVKGQGIFLDCLVNNAGFGTVGSFADIDLLRELEMVDVNVRAVLELTHHFLPQMIGRRKGTIINVSSTASFQPIPYLATYSATKAFVTSLSEALWGECRGTGVHVLNLCPGRTKTHFGKVAGQKIEGKNDFRPSQSPEAVVDMAFKALRKNNPTLVTNPLDNSLRFLERFVTRKFAVSTAAKIAKWVGYHK